ncbi:dihydropteroate synthase [Aliidiomarina iranensis]|uniref:Dihydropteroate synthase n=1 Tax=Aliidiomarina iranensis TaxID=1434071 RepID=A0A432VWW0_9GAMM|nr:dihydropteroate synthase [Aliidiomarina iranensis]RUO21181.1 dihydropteroate synthase [Aliidiomarina iranensis]
MAQQRQLVQVMGILNVTPDSFSDGGRYNSIKAAVQRASEMVTAGADWLDVGGESTRPGAADVAENEELERVIPVIEAIKREFAVHISVDTSKPAVMREAVAAGAEMINDVRALREPGALAAAAVTNAKVCLMHMIGQPRTMQEAPEYENLVADIKSFLQERINACEAAGISRERILLDPGFGFGKTVRHNYELLHRLQCFQEFELPLLIGLSRKSMLGKVTGKDVDERLAASIAGATIAMMKGAAVLRVHDVAETKDAVKVVTATLTGEY